MVVLDLKGGPISSIESNYGRFLVVNYVSTLDGIVTLVSSRAHGYGDGGGVCISVRVVE